MKAKEYAKKYIQTGSEGKSGCLMEILDDFFKEMSRLIYIRNAKSDSAIFSIFDELDKKWVSFVTRVNDNLRKDGFKLFIEKLNSEIYNRWSTYNEVMGSKPRKTSVEIRAERFNTLQFGKTLKEGSKKC